MPLSETFLALFLLGLPFLVLVLSLRSPNRTFRRLVMLSVGLWVLGLLVLVVLDFDCDGSFPHDFTQCRSLSETLANALVPRAVTAMAGAIVLYAMAGVFAWLARSRRRHE